VNTRTLHLALGLFSTLFHYSPSCFYLCPFFLLRTLIAPPIVSFLACQHPLPPTQWNPHTPCSLISSNKLPPEDIPRPTPIWPSAIHCKFVHLKEHRIMSFRTATTISVTNTHTHTHTHTHIYTLRKTFPSKRTETLKTRYLYRMKREKNQQDAANLMFIIKRLSQHISSIIMPIIRRTRSCTTACGVLHWLCWLWLWSWVASCVHCAQ